MRVYYHTFGCKANQYDTERMRQEGEARGARTVPSWTEAEVCVVNTCTVTNQADAEARRFVRRLARERPGLRVIVAGCSAALRAADYRGMEEVAGVVEGHDPVRVAGALRSDAPVQLGLRAPLDRIDSEPIGGELLRRREGASRGWLKVQDGCDRKCSFCATRLARGVSRSRPPAEVVAEARALAMVHPELVVTGIHIGHYGRDLEPRWTLARLLALLLERVPDVRFRLGSVEATEVDEDLLAILADSHGRMAPHLHMPLQSGADPVLRRMRRWHTREEYRRRTWEIVERVGLMGLGADVITGFPGETDADHGTTLELVEELPFTYLHVFPYSPREGTPAADLAEPVPQRVAGERSRELRTLAHEKGRAYRASRVGGAAEVVLEGRGGTALTGDYLRVGTGGAPPGGAEVPPPTRGNLAARTDGAGPESPAAHPGGRPARPGLFRGTLRGSGEHLYIESPREIPLV